MTIEPKKRLSNLWLRIAENIDGDFMEIFLITSQSAGLEPSMGRPFGVGKSTLAIWMAYRAFSYYLGKLRFEGEKIIDENSYEERIEIMKKILDNYIVWKLDDLIRVISSARGFLPAVIWDDVQRDCPAWQHIPRDKREKIEYLTMTRQRVANIILTAPSMGDIARPLRRNVTWEIIVPRRGIYEVQFVAKRRAFYNPADDYSRLWYEATGTFDPLPEEIDKLYKILRDSQLNVKVSGFEVEEELGRKRGGRFIDLGF